MEIEITNSSLEAEISSGGATEIFYATYNTTTDAELKAAIQAGLYIVVKHGYWIASPQYVKINSSTGAIDGRWHCHYTTANTDGKMYSSYDYKYTTADGWSRTTNSGTIGNAVPTQPSTGTYVLKAVNGTQQWVEET